MNIIQLLLEPILKNCQLERKEKTSVKLKKEKYIKEEIVFENTVC